MTLPGADFGLATEESLLLYVCESFSRVLTVEQGKVTCVAQYWQIVSAFKNGSVFFFFSFVRSEINKTYVIGSKSDRWRVS